MPAWDRQVAGVMRIRTATFSIPPQKMCELLKFRAQDDTTSYFNQIRAILILYFLYCGCGSPYGSLYFDSPSSPASLLRCWRNFNGFTVCRCCCCTRPFRRRTHRRSLVSILLLLLPTSFCNCVIAPGPVGEHLLWWAVIFVTNCPEKLTFRKKRNYSSSRNHCWQFGHRGIFNHSAYINIGEGIGAIGMLFQYPPSNPISLCRHFLPRCRYLAVYWHRWTRVSGTNPLPTFYWPGVTSFSSTKKKNIQCGDKLLTAGYMDCRPGSCCFRIRSLACFCYTPRRYWTPDGVAPSGRQSKEGEGYKSVTQSMYKEKGLPAPCFVFIL